MTKGLQLAKEFYFDCVRQIIAEHAPELESVCAAGLLGWGSDVLGNDDELSRDHEWGPRLLLFLPGAEHSRFAKRLDRILSESLPPTFRGFPTRFVREKRLWDSLVMSDSPEGRHHVAITTFERFLELALGFKDGPQRDLDWLFVPEQRLLEFVSGEIFSDPTGKITHLREALSYFPVVVWKYRLAYAFESLGWDLDLVSQCGKRGDVLSMHLNISTSVERIMKLVFLLNKRYCPGYPKWLQREFSKLSFVAAEIEPLLREAFVSDEWTKVEMCLNEALQIAYQRLKEFPEFSHLPEHMGRREFRGISVTATQPVARAILDTIEGPLGKLRILGAPYGSVDQWVTNQDILTFFSGLDSFRSVFNSPNIRMDRFDDMI